VALDRWWNRGEDGFGGTDGLGTARGLEMTAVWQHSKGFGDDSGLAHDSEFVTDSGFAPRQRFRAYTARHHPHDTQLLGAFPFCPISPPYQGQTCSCFVAACPEKHQSGLTYLLQAIGDEQLPSSLTFLRCHYPRPSRNDA
jgi:hypothetical protein